LLCLDALLDFLGFSKYRPLKVRFLSHMLLSERSCSYSASLSWFLGRWAELVDRIGGFLLNILFATRGAHDLRVLFSHVSQKSRERMPASLANKVGRSGRHT
jgi:hypothetical protein